MNYTVKFESKAKQFLKKNKNCLELKAFAQQMVNSLKKNPTISNPSVKKISTVNNHYRYKKSRKKYRGIYYIELDSVYIIKIGKRDNIYNNINTL